MACGNNNNRGGNLGGLKNILDFNVTYTGCETSCGGREIKTGDSLRNVLDALVANCDGGSGPIGSSTNFWFSRNVPTFTADVKENDFALTGSGAIYEFVDGGWQNTGIQIGGGSGGGGSWGEITGNIDDQTDLTEYINLLTSDRVGTNLHLDEDGKINAGVNVLPLDGFDIDYVMFTTKGTEEVSFQDASNTDGIFLWGAEDEEQDISQSSLTLKTSNNEGTSVIEMNGNETSISSDLLRISGDVVGTSLGRLELRTVAAADLTLSRGNSANGFFATAANTSMTMAGNGTFQVRESGPAIQNPNAQTPTVFEALSDKIVINTGLQYQFHLSANGGNRSRGTGFITKENTEQQGEVTHYDISLEGVGWDSSGPTNANIRPVIRYESGMPTRESFITGNTLPTIDHVSSMIDDTVSALETTVSDQAALIADLTTRLEALENA